MNQQLLNYFFKLNLLITKFSFETNELVDALILAQQNIFYFITLNNIELKKYLKIIKKSLLSIQFLPFNISYMEEFLKLT